MSFKDDPRLIVYDMPCPDHTMPNRKCFFNPDLFRPYTEGTNGWLVFQERARLRPWFKKLG